MGHETWQVFQSTIWAQNLTVNVLFWQVLVYLGQFYTWKNANTFSQWCLLKVMGWPFLITVWIKIYTRFQLYLMVFNTTIIISIKVWRQKLNSDTDRDTKHYHTNVIRRNQTTSNDLNLYMKAEQDWLQPNFPVSVNSSCREVQTIHLGKILTSFFTCRQRVAAASRTAVVPRSEPWCDR